MALPRHPPHPQCGADKATHFLVEPQAHRGLREVVEVMREAPTDKHAGTISPELPDLAAIPGSSFDYQHTRYCVERGASGYQPLTFPTGLAPAEYHAWRGLESSDAAESVRTRFGANEMHMPAPTFSALLLEHVLAPFFVFQLFCVGLWCLDEYWYLSIFTLFMLLTLESFLVVQRVQQHTSLRAMRPVPADTCVWRGGRWASVPGSELVPGDIVEVRAPAHRDIEALKARQEAAKMAAGPPTPDRMAKALLGMGAPAAPALPDPSVVPADVLLLRGSAVVNEAMLTGESIPQLKEAAAPSGETAPADKWPQALSRSIVLSGTSLVSSSAEAVGAEEADEEDEADGAGSPGRGAAAAARGGDPLAVAPTPNGGALGVVLRTGFYTSQGDLMRTILFSTRRVTVENRDSYLFIAGLLVFALAASAYVLREGLAQEGRDVWKLVLHCILVVTSVVPPELPVQLSMAVNNSLAALARKRVFCTEPFRIPNAGHVDACCFDKTGTLTSDQLLVRGVAYCDGDAKLATAAAVRAAASARPASADRTAKSKPGLLETPDAAAALAAARVTVVPAELAHRDSTAVLAGCHSVVPAEGGLAGDPLECAALAALGWTVGAGARARPLLDGEAPPVMAGSGSKPNGGLRPSASAAGFREGVTVLRRWPFSSALRRMTTLVRLPDGATRVVTKGAPEAIAGLLASPPAGYHGAATALSLAGARVIALAWRPITLPAKSTSRRAVREAAAAVDRDAAESGLRSAGFLVLDCPLKPDSETVVTQLREADEAVVMITGDHPLTAVAVSRKIGILPAPDGGSLLPDEARAEDAASALADSAAAASGLGVPARPAAGRGASVVRILEADPGHAAGSASSGSRWRVVTQPLGESPSEAIETFLVDDVAGKPLQRLYPGQDVCVTGSGLKPLLALADAEARAKAGRGAAPAPAAAASLSSSHKSKAEQEEEEDASGDGASGSGLKWAGMGPSHRCVARLCSECVVFARVAPTQKERVITMLNSLGRGTLMCGDGTNDVGALKQAGVGVSIVSDPELEDRLDTIEGEREALVTAARSLGPANAPGGADAVGSAEAVLRERRAAKSARAAERAADKERKSQAVATGFESDSEDDKGAKAKPKRGAWTDPVRLAKQQLKLRSISRDSPEGRRALAAARMQREFRDMEREMSMEAATVQFGDASIAAPFTSKRPSPRVALDIMLQGRCTLVTTHQMFRILAVNSLVASYSLSALYLHGARSGDTQATITGIAMSAFFMMMSFAKPLEKLSKAKPDTTVFKPHLLLSVFGQFLIHLSAMMIAVHICEPYVEFVPNPFLATPPAAAAAVAAVPLGDDAAAAAAAAAAASMDDGDWDVTGFGGAGAAGLDAATSADAASTTRAPGVEEVTMDGDFKPNVLNTVVFLVNIVQQATTFAVNYRGRPFLPGFWENVAFSRGLMGLYALAFVAATGVIDLNDMLQLVPMPTEAFGHTVVAILAADVLLSFGLETFLRRAYKVPTE